MRRILAALAILLAWGGAASAQHDDERSVPETDPLVLENLAHWQDIKFGLLMHWGPYSQWGVVESWSICAEDEGWCRRSLDDYVEYKRRYEGLKKTFNPMRFDPGIWARNPKAPVPSTWIIRGRVVAADTGQALRRARVTLSAPELTSERAVETDLDGRYVFSDLPAGRFRVKASKALFVPIEFGQRRPFEAGRTIELGEGMTLEKIDIALPRGSVIAGRVVDDLGEPVAWARVSAMRSRYEQGKRTFVDVGRSAVTNDLGEYRLYGLPPGSHVVGSIPEPTPSDDGYPFAPAYYPGTQNPAQARRVAVGLGQERGGIDFVQPPGRLVTLSGTVMDSRGRSLAGAGVSLVNVRIGSRLGGTVKTDGSFTIPNIAPGDYFLAAFLPDPATGQRDSVMFPLTVYSDDVGGLVLPIVPGSRVTGRVVTERGGPPPFEAAGLRVGIHPLPSELPTRLPTAARGATPGAVSADWTFELTGVSGASLFTIGKLPAGWWLKSVRLEGRDITDTPLEIRGTETVSGLEVVVTDRTTEISGTVTDVKDKPVQEYTVVVFAEDASRWAWPSRFIKTARADQTGAFTLTNLPAGTYLVVALDYVEEGDSNDPEFLESIRAKGTRSRSVMETRRRWT